MRTILYKRNLFLYVLLAAGLGAASGAVVSLLLYIMNLGIKLVWEIIPEYIGVSDIYSILYTVGVCLLGGVLIGLWQRKHGIYPQSLEEVMHELKSTGSYPYDKIPVLAVAALLPLIFGGCLGPEAGLTGIIAGLCCLVSDKLKYKGHQMREMAEAGMAATLGVVFNSPFIGIAFNYESEAAAESDSAEKAETSKSENDSNKAECEADDDKGASGGIKTADDDKGASGGIKTADDTESAANSVQATVSDDKYATGGIKTAVDTEYAADDDKFAKDNTKTAVDFTTAGNTQNNGNSADKAKLKKLKLMVYIVSVASALGAMKLIGLVLGSSGGVPRFGSDVAISIDDWKWFAVVFAAGLLAGIMYVVVNKITSAIGNKLIKYRITSCMIAGALLAAIGLAFPQTMFSGEHQMSELMTTWQTESAAMLIMTALMKLLLVNLCINLGWKGGSIFPVIFSGVSLGYAMAMVLGICPMFAVAVCTAALCGYTMRKPVMVIGVLLLCFPVTLIIPLAAAAYLGSIVPAPKTEN